MNVASLSGEDAADALKYWKKKYDDINAVYTLTEISDDTRVAMAVVSFYCLTLYRLLVKSTASIYSLLITKSHGIYNALFCGLQDAELFQPIHYNNFTRIASMVSIRNEAIKTTFGVLVGLHIKWSTDQIGGATKLGVLNSTCLLHTACNGMATLKLLDQIEKLTHLDNAKALSQMCTFLTRSSILLVVGFLAAIDQRHSLPADVLFPNLQCPYQTWA